LKLIASTDVMIPPEAISTRGNFKFFERKKNALL